MPRQDRATKLFTYLADVIVNGNPLVKNRPATIRREPAPVPTLDHKQPIPAGTRQKLLELGPEKFCKWILEQKPLLLTDTTFRDAHQSLLATRMRTYDMLAIAEAYARLMPAVVLARNVGRGDVRHVDAVSARSAPGSGWPSCASGFPTSCFRCCCGPRTRVGYTNYPDNVVQGVRARVGPGGHRPVPHFRFAQLGAEHARGHGRGARNRRACAKRPSATPATSSIPKRPKYDLKYYVDLAKELEKMGAHILAIKDMAGLCKPYAAEVLVQTLKQEIGIPIHFHTHDTSGVQAAVDSEGGRSRARHRRRRDGADVGPDVAAESELDRRGAAVHAARHAASSSKPCKPWPTTGRRCASSTRRSRPA